VKIVFYANGGSPMGVTPETYWNRGTGGAETALVWIAFELALRGHEVTVYNDAAGNFHGVQYRDRREFSVSEPVDAFVLFRNPWMGVTRVNAGVKVFWSCDQQTEGDYTLGVLPWVDNVVVISPYHLAYHVDRYGLDPDVAWVTDLGVNWNEYEVKRFKVKNRLIYCSQPERGLQHLFEAWPLIEAEIPDVSLTITADRRLWGVDYTGDEKYRAAWAGSDRIDYVGAVPRKKLVELQLEADVLAYPCTYEELFCLSVAECQVAGAVPVTTTMGSLPTTLGVGVQVDGIPGVGRFAERFAEAVVGLLKDRKRLSYLQTKAQNYSAGRFPWSVIAEAWEQKLEEWIDAR